MAQIYNSRKEEYKSPFGALATGQQVRFALRVPQSHGCKTPMLFVEREGAALAQHPLLPSCTAGDDDWFAVELTLEEPGLHFYWFDLWVDFKKVYKGKGGKGVVDTEPGEKFPLVVYDAAFQTPKSFHGSVMYQIFPDRFLEGDLEMTLSYNERIYRADKQNEPYFWGELKSYGSLSQDYFAGDFLGIQ